MRGEGKGRRGRSGLAEACAGPDANGRGGDVNGGREAHLVAHVEALRDHVLRRSDVLVRLLQPLARPLVRRRGLAAKWRPRRLEHPVAKGKPDGTQAEALNLPSVRRGAIRDSRVALKWHTQVWHSDGTKRWPLRWFSEVPPAAGRPS